MTTATFASDIVQQKELTDRSTACVVWAVSRDSYLSADPLGDFRRAGYGRFIKSAVDPIDADAAVPLLPLNAAFVAAVDAISVLGRIPGAVRFELGGAARLQSTPITASQIDEGTLKPVNALTFTVPPAPTKVVAQVVATAEALRTLGPAQPGVAQILIAACARAVDAQFVTALTAAGTPTGPTAAALLSAIADAAVPVVLGTLGGLLNLGAGIVRDLEALGVTIFSSPAAAGSVFAFDGAAVLVADDAVNVATARHASVALDDAPDTETPIVNLWQRNLVGIRAERWTRIGIRSGTVAIASTGSPAL